MVPLVQCRTIVYGLIYIFSISFQHSTVFIDNESITKEQITEMHGNGLILVMITCLTLGYINGAEVKKFERDGNIVYLNHSETIRTIKSILKYKF